MDFRLSCCGIDAAEPAEAAARFARLMEEQPEIVDRLAALEHRRWVMDKLLQGYRQIDNFDLLYSGPPVKLVFWWRICRWERTVSTSRS